MKVAVATVQTPFLRGGAEEHAEELERALSRHGHQAEIVSVPFRFSPPAEIRRTMRFWQEERFDRFSGQAPDATICLRFPAYGLSHPSKVVWLLHQHRAVYDCWQDTLAEACDTDTADLQQLRQEIMEFDSKHLRKAAKLRANSANVAKRLKEFNGFEAEPLYHPPPLASRIVSGDPLPYIFYPSRLEALKRQDLLIQALKFVTRPIRVLIAGQGGLMAYYEQHIRQAGLEDRVRLLGRIDTYELLAGYARCLGVFFGPRDEDYGYVTLEAMLASKPVITCTDSGGPLEFVEHGHNGLICQPEPRAVAEALDRLAADWQEARAMGRRGRDRYRELNISWDRVVRELLG